MSIAQIVAIVIFVAMFVVIISDKVHRCIPALVGAALTIGVTFLLVMREPQAIWNTLNLGHFTELSFWIPGASHAENTVGINWTTIIFILGMMIMVEGLGDAGFFRWLCLWLAKKVHYKIIPLFIVFMIMSAFLAMFIDSITVILFLAAVTIELARLLKFNPIPMVISEIFSANLGGAATMSGDPPNIIIGTANGFTFMDFFTNTGVVVWIAMIVMILVFYFDFRKDLKSTNDNTADIEYPDPGEAIKSKGKFITSTLIFLFMVVCLVLHGQLGWSVAFIGVITAGLTLIVNGKNSFHLLKKVDWLTILFFIGLFVVVGGLEETGVLNMLSKLIAQITGEKIILAIVIILWSSAIFSAIVDNIPLAATLVPVIKTLSVTQGFDLEVLSWSLALGADIGGNATPIGASANVVGTSIVAREYHPITWKSYMRASIPATVITLTICTAYIIIRYVIM
jgi:Na+/H+ antiporter NhaD/arsenite permease-like protein